MPYLDAAELPTSPQLFIERRKIKKKSANYQIFPHKNRLLIELNRFAKENYYF
jgi:hypothetical protein